MAVTYFPFNSIVVEGVPDRPANAESLAAYLAGFFSNGVLMQEDTALKVATDSGMNVQINAGVGNINGKTILNDAAEIVPLEVANATLGRIDRVVFRLDEANRLMEFDVLTGTPASNPVPPELTQNADVYELCLAEVRVPAGASEILASHITDTRMDAELCGVASIPPHMQNIEHGGTGADNAAGARQNINFIGRNIIANRGEDTPSFWIEQGTGVIHIYNSPDLTIGQPTANGLILNLVNPAGSVRQLWFTLTTGDIYHRGGNTSNGWSPWLKIIDRENIMFDVGSIAGANIAAGAYRDINITFNKRFADAPIVSFNLYSSSGDGGVGKCSAAYVPNSGSETGCLVRIFNGDTVARAPGLEWRAMNKALFV